MPASNASHLIGVDVGTSATKVILIDASGKVVASAAPEYPFETPRPLWAEANPEDWWRATVEGIREVLKTSGVEPGSIAGIGLSGQMHGLVLLDAKGEVLRPCIMWNDQRTGEECAAITDIVGKEEIIEITGNPVLPGFTAPKLSWVKKHEPEVFGRIAHWLLPKDYIRYRLTGEFFSDVSDASGTSLLQVSERKWSTDIVDALGFDTAWLPEVTESVEPSTRVSAEAARLTGLPEGLPIAAGGGDQAAQAVGCGIVREGILSATFGTSGVVFAHSDEYRVESDGRLHAFCHAVRGKWHLMGVMLSAAGSYQWFRKTFLPEFIEQCRAEGKDDYQVLDEMAAAIEPGSEGLVFLPYLSGERTPHPDPHARGVFMGMTLRHQRAHFVRAVLEGITFGMRDSLQLMRSLGIKAETITVSGGGANSPFWRQMMADVFATRTNTVNATEGAAFGAALLAGVAAGVYPDVETACGKTLAQTTEVEPDSKTAKTYEKLYPRYTALYPLLRETFADLSSEK